jgi:glucose-1-phosphate adenylyltransferase
VTGFEEKPSAERLAELGSSSPSRSPVDRLSADRPFVASMGIYVFTRDVLHDILSDDQAIDFGREIIPHALTNRRVHSYLHRDYWADVGTVPSFYDVNLMLTRRGAPFNFYHPNRPVYTRPRFLPAARLLQCRLDEALIAEGAYLDTCEVTSSVIGIRTAVQSGTRITRSIVLGADFYENSPTDVPLGIGRNVVLDRVIVDKNARIGDGARLVNEAQVQEADGDGYCIRNGIIIVPKNGVVSPRTVV